MNKIAELYNMFKNENMEKRAQGYNEELDWWKNIPIEEEDYVPGIGNELKPTMGEPFRYYNDFSKMKDVNQFVNFKDKVNELTNATKDNPLYMYNRFADVKKGTFPKRYETPDPLSKRIKGAYDDIRKGMGRK